MRTISGTVGVSVNGLFWVVVALVALTIATANVGGAIGKAAKRVEGACVAAHHDLPQAKPRP